MKRAWQVLVPRAIATVTVVIAAPAYFGAAQCNTQRPAPATAHRTSNAHSSVYSLEHILRDLDDERDLGSPDLSASYNIAAAAAFRHPDDAGALWSAARAAYDLSQQQMPSMTSAQKRELLLYAQSQLNAAKQLAAGRASNDVYRWAGMVLEALSATTSTTEYIKNSFVVRDEWRTAIAIDPADAAAQHLLGRWHLSVAETPSWKRAIAGALFAEPPTATFDEALQYFMRAEELSPNFWIANQRCLGQTELRLGNRSAAAQWLASAARLPVRSADDRVEHDAAMQLLRAADASLVRACR